MTQPRCEDCRHWKPFGTPYERAADRGECRRFPPTRGVYEARFPQTTTGDWCGEFAERERP